MTGIWEFEQKDQLEELIVNTSLSVSRAIGGEEDIPPQILQTLQLTNIFIFGEWGDGDAELRDTPLDVHLFFDVRDESLLPTEDSPGEDPLFSEAVEQISRSVETIFNERTVNTTQLMDQWFLQYTFSGGYAGSVPERVRFEIDEREGVEFVYDLTSNKLVTTAEDGGLVAVDPGEEVEAGDVVSEPEPEDPGMGEFQVGDAFREATEEGIIEDPLERVIRGVPTEFDELPEEEQLNRISGLPREEQFERVKGLPKERQVRLLYPDVTDEMFPYLQRDGDLEIPTGKKQTKTVEPRDPYEFEVQMATPGNVAGAGVTNREILTGIGESIFLGRYGDEHPPSNFPRTSHYIRNRLLFEGPTYILDLYRDLVFYSGYMTSVTEDYFMEENPERGNVNLNFRPGLYENFRNTIHKIKTLGEEGGPELIRPLTGDEAMRRGFDTIPKIERSDGEVVDATWLENRRYYEIKSGNRDHPAWDNPVGYLYEEVL